MAVALSTLSLGATAQVNIDFESPESYKSIGVYDAWGNSPFRTGELTGNFAITANPDPTSVNDISGDIPNASALVLGAQRSRFASNTFGVRVDLNEVWETNPNVQYVHVMLYKPVTDGRVMLIGLGSREERLGQNPYCEQFWEISTVNVKPGTWCDAVFPIKTANGVNIRSLVLVPDCEPPHKLADDFLFYIDNIEVNDSPLPRVPNEYYPISGDKATKAMTRTDRSTSRLNFKVGTENQYADIKQSTNKLLYQDVLSTTFYAQAGQTVTPSISFSGVWMHAYCYIDYNQNGQFSYEINEDGTPAEGSELVAYNHYNGKNSKGANASENLGSNCGTLPSFTLPDNLAPGMYRVRMKIDWNSIDPMGCSDAGNLIEANGGVIADAMLCIYADKVVLNDFQLNGEVLAADGTKLSAYEVPANQEFTIKSAPEKGFHNGGVIVNTGYNLNSERIDKYGNPQYNTYTIPASDFNEDGTYTIAAKKMRANILFNGIMTEDGAAVPDETIYTLAFPKDLKIERTDRKLNSFSINNGTNEVTVSLDDNTENFVYVDKTVTTVIPVQAGQTITPSLNYNGNAMHNYWFVDFNEDGQFSNTLNADGSPSGELLSYSCYDNKNSRGESISVPGQVSVNQAVPFTIPASTPAGLYRCRMKVDWNNIDPAGQYGLGENDIDDNGGYVVDFLFHVYDNTAAVTTNVDNKTGNLVSGDVQIGATYAAARLQPIEIANVTSNGVAIKGIKARYGYHLDNQQAYHLNHTYWTEEALALTEGNFVIEANKVDRPIQLTVEFDESDSINDIIITPEGGNTYDLRGIRVDRPSNGIYIINGQKVHVK